MKKPKRKYVTKEDRRRAWAIGIAREEAKQAASDRAVETLTRETIVASIVAYQCTADKQHLTVPTPVEHLQALLRQLDRARLAVLQPK